ncbi:MAG TPA: tetratricopeptide repeat protein, partial [Kofleriaceae bacterium]
EDCAKQCDAGEALSCAFAGTIYERGTGVKPNPQTAFKYYQQACKAGNLDGCTGQAMLYSKGTGVPRDDKRADQMLNDACTKGNGRACSGLGQRLRLKGDIKPALPLFNRACSFGYARACFYYGSFGVKAGMPESVARKSFERACLGRDLRGCLGAATFASSGDNAAKQQGATFLDMGLKGLERACTASDGEACNVLGDYHSGQYDPAQKDPTKAKDYYDSACKAGQTDACKSGGGPVGKPPGKGPGKAPPPPPPPGPKPMKQGPPGPPPPPPPRSKP